MIYLCPTSDFVYRIWNHVTQSYDEGENPIVVNDSDRTVLELICQNNIKLNIYDTSLFDDFFTLAKDEDGVSIASEKQMLISLRATEVPSNFETFELYMEDGNGRKATYSLSDTDMGEIKRIILSAFVYDKGFNKSFVTRFGVHIKGKKTDIEQFKLIIDKLALVSSPMPNYCQPQDVINFLGIRNNDGTPFMLDESTVPSYDTVADYICQAEGYIDQTTRNAWKEKRAVNEIRNASSTRTGTGSAYLGILQPSSAYSPITTFSRGIAVKLIYGNVKDIDPAKGDKVEIRMYGNEWVDATGSVWLDNAKGILYIRKIFLQQDASVRVTYRYGSDTNGIPDDIRKASMLYAGKQIVLNQSLYRYLFPEDNGMFDRQRNIALDYEYQIRQILAERSEQICVGGL